MTSPGSWAAGGLAGKAITLPLKYRTGLPPPPAGEDGGRAVPVPTLGQ